MKLAPLKIGDLTARIPILQGAMGVGVSRAHLAAAVANAGGVGVIAGTGLGYNEPDFLKSILESSIRAITKEIKKARELSPNGIIGINFLVALQNYEDFVKAAVTAGVDLIVSGAGLPTSLPELVKGSNTKIAPIVSSGKAANVICKLWTKRYDRIPDLIIVEGPDAGGHLGYSMDELTAETKPDLIKIVKDVLNAVAPYAEKYGKQIPVIAAGGIFDGKDIRKFIELGAAGVQMATRFIATEECDAHINFKNVIINAGEHDLQLVKSPVGLPGRAVRSEMIKRIEKVPAKITKCNRCIKTCNPKESPYCICQCLIDAVNGNTEDGLFFSGTNAYRVDKIITVQELMDELVQEAEAD